MADPASFTGRDRAALRRHLSSYWKMEAGNALLLPAFVLAALWFFEDAPDFACWFGLVACALLLVIGAMAWRLALAGLDGDAGLAERLTAACALLQYPALALTVVAVAALLANLPAGWPPRTIAAAIATILAVLEYVNYYHWQLQNFDSAIDWKRLRSGRGLRRAHLGRAVRAWRKGHARNRH